MTALDFQAAEDIAATAINEGLAGRLELSEIDSRSRLVAAQSSQSDIGWSSTLNVQSVKGRFAVLQDYEQRWVDMVRIEGLMNVNVEDGFAVVEIPLAEDELSLLMITPALGLFDEIRSRFDEEFLQEQLEKLVPAQASIMVPKFEIVRDVSENEMPDLGVALLDPAPKPLVLDSDGATQWTINEDGQVVVLTEDVEVDSDNVANFFHVNEAGYLYVLPPLQAIDFSVGEDGVVASSVSAIVHEASVSEPSWLIGSFPEQGGGSFSGNLISTLGPNENRCFYPPDQSRFFFALFARETGTLLHLGHVVTLNGEIVTPDWTTFFNCGDSPPVEIYQYTGAILCESNGVSLQHAKESLVNEGIEVLQWGSANDGLVSSNLCGVSSGDLNLFTIRNRDLSLAESLGFKRVSELPPEVQLIY